MTVKLLVMMSKLRAAVLGNSSALAKGGDVGLLCSYRPVLGAWREHLASAFDLYLARPAGPTWEEALWTSP